MWGNSLNEARKLKAHPSKNDSCFTIMWFSEALKCLDVLFKQLCRFHVRKSILNIKTSVSWKNLYLTLKYGRVGRNEVNKMRRIKSPSASTHAPEMLKCYGRELAAKKTPLLPFTEGSDSRCDLYR